MTHIKEKSNKEDFEKLGQITTRDLGYFDFKKPGQITERDLGCFEIKRRQGHYHLTKRDFEILNFIHELGFCEMPQLVRLFALQSKTWSVKRSYQIMRRLELLRYLRHVRLLHRRHGVYFLTPEGARITESKLPALETISLATYEHQLAIVDVHLKCKERYPQANWISERLLQQEKYQTGVGKRGHLADAVLVLEDNTKVAIEVELHLKNKTRLIKILREYGAQFDLTEVWYFCRPAILKSIERHTEKWPFIKVYELEAPLP